MHWGGKVDEFDAWSALPTNIYASARTTVDGRPINILTAGKDKTKFEKPENIIGVQAQLWGETLRSFDEVQYLLKAKDDGRRSVSAPGMLSPEWSKNSMIIRPDFEARYQYNLKIGTQRVAAVEGQGPYLPRGPPGIKLD